MDASEYDLAQHRGSLIHIQRREREASRLASHALIALIVGAVCGLLSLLPGYGTYDSGYGKLFAESSTLRVLKFAAPFSLLLLGREIFPLRHDFFRTKPFETLMIVGIFIGLPLVAAVMSREGLLLQFAVLPQAVSFLVLTMLVSLRFDLFKSFALGIGLAAMFLLLHNLVTVGIHADRMYVRLRVLLGMNHPLPAAMMVLGATTGLTMILKAPTINHWMTHSTHLSQRALNRWIWALGLTSFGMLIMVSSRNTVLAVLVGGMAYGACRWLRPSLMRDRVFTLLGLVIPLGSIAAVLMICWGLLPLNSQLGRLGNFTEAMQQSLAESNPQMIFGVGPSRFIMGGLERNPSHILRLDSIFASYGHYFGPTSLLALFALFAWMGFTCLRKKSYIAVAIWAGLMSFFTLDSQGMTISNMILFVFFSYLTREFLDLNRVEDTRP